MTLQMAFAGDLKGIVVVSCALWAMARLDLGSRHNMEVLDAKACLFGFREQVRRGVEGLLVMLYALEMHIMQL